MTNSLRQYPALLLATAFCALPACSTREISADPVVFPDNFPSADRGLLQIGFAPPEVTFEEQQANVATHTNLFHVFLDGEQLAWWSTVGPPEALEVVQGGSVRIGYLPAGTHHFEFRAAGGGQTVFAGDGAIPAGLMTQLYLFGPAGAVQGRFISYPAVPAVGLAHVSLTNLVRSGQSIEVVGCTDISQCAPLSAPLALGETFAADFPMDATQDWPNGRFVVSSGLALGYRQVPTTAVSAPRVYALPPQIVMPDGVSAPSATLVGAPVYMALTGDIQLSF
jgi:hypothetical protein